MIRKDGKELGNRIAVSRDSLEKMRRERYASEHSLRTPSGNSCVIKCGKKLHCAPSRLAKFTMRRESDCLMRSIIKNTYF